MTHTHSYLGNLLKEGLSNDLFTLHPSSFLITLNIPGHFTVKVDPLSVKQYLHEFGFYDCDSLLQPFCNQDQLKAQENNRIDLSEDVNLKELLTVSHSALHHGRFHRDFM